MPVVFRESISKPASPTAFFSDATADAERSTASEYDRHTPDSCPFNLTLSGLAYALPAPVTVIVLSIGPTYGWTNPFLS